MRRATSQQRDPHRQQQHGHAQDQGDQTHHAGKQPQDGAAQSTKNPHDQSLPPCPYPDRSRRHAAAGAGVRADLAPLKGPTFNARAAPPARTDTAPAERLPSPRTTAGAGPPRRGSGRERRSSGSGRGRESCAPVVRDTSGPSVPASSRRLCQTRSRARWTGCDRTASGPPPAWTTEPTRQAPVTGWSVVRLEVRRGDRPGPAAHVHGEPGALDPAAAHDLDGLLEQGADDVQLGELSRQRIDPPKSPPRGSSFATSRTVQPGRLVRPGHDCVHEGLLPDAGEPPLHCAPLRRGGQPPD